ncbi:hypothetical protein DH2020_027698 [Rehmannia glutinosa]|uniref:F-box domain-containing protein n=1 Tax=Rehmannia glutinosa TaxID=99300 RepID=A0ABR0VTG6_REHGL
MLIYSSILVYNHTFVLACQGTITMEAESSTVHELSSSFPDEIVTEILTRLPVKSLLRFRCVSKSWLSLISSPAFIKMHLKTANNDIMYSHHRLICISANPHNHFREFSLRFLLHEAAVGSITLNYTVGNPDIPIRIVGSCNGMVCVAIDEENLILWNPSIRKYKRLPFLHIRSGSGCYMKDGFGFDEFNDDYKVVAIFFSIFQYGPYKVLIFSLKANKWRRIEDFKNGMPLDHSGKYVNGKLHWLVDIDGCMDIVSLDLASERYEKMGVPHNADNGFDDPCLTLGLFSKVSTLHNSAFWNAGFYPHMLRLWLLNNGEILLSYGCVIVIYNPKDNIYRYPPIDNIASIHQGDVFVESLVSPSVDDTRLHEE